LATLEFGARLIRKRAIPKQLYVRFIVAVPCNKDVLFHTSLHCVSISVGFVIAEETWSRNVVYLFHHKPHGQ